MAVLNYELILTSSSTRFDENGVNHLDGTIIEQREKLTRVFCIRGNESGTSKRRVKSNENYNCSPAYDRNDYNGTVNKFSLLKNDKICPNYWLRAI